jgi:nucleoside-diphosphate kinase
MARTFSFIKPDGVQRGLIGEVLRRFEQKGLTLVAADLRQIDRATAEAHYAEHAGKGFFDAIVTGLTSGPIFTMVLEGPEDVAKIVRTMMGATNPAESAPGTIRGDFGTEMQYNIIHGSDSPESAAREIALFFPELAK